MPNLTSKTTAARRLMMSVALLLAGVLAIQCQPQPTVRATDDLVGTGGGGGRTADPQPGGQSNAAAGIKPVAVIYEIDPWGMVLGSDSPSFALYEDGMVIFARSKEGGGYEYASATLGAEERDSLLRSLPSAQFFGLEPRYETTLITDQPTYVITLWDKGQRKTVSVYGGLKRTDNDRKEPAPAAFIETYEKLKGLRPAGASRWMPEKVELMIWPYEDASDPLPWPKNWPDTAHPTTKKRGAGGDQINYSIYLTPAQYETLKKSAERKSAEALLIDGRKWAFSFRYPFPGEDSWRKNKG
ncbi:MAG TPA: hypothetical protein VN256_07510 [Pyrinomonadaceae bacterium]|nr:hypothetical protein [Pyrinomonadaceae bacterium]